VRFSGAAADGHGGMGGIHVENAPAARAGAAGGSAHGQHGLFRAMQIPLVAGRFSQIRTARTRSNVVIN